MQRWIKLGVNIWKAPISRYFLFLEASICLFLARMALKLLPYQKISNFLKRPLGKKEIFGEERVKTEKEISWAIDSSCKHLPLKFVCFPRAIAAHEMLRRRGILATLYFGATTLAEEGLSTHAWLQDGPNGIVGHANAKDYNVLAQYPS